MEGVVKEIQRLNAREAALNINSVSGSWHDQFKDSAYVFVGGLPYELTEGDVICVMSQFGEIASINLVRDKETGKSKGYAFIKYLDQRSTVLAVDNMNGSQVKGRTLRVDHVQNYKVPKKVDEDGNEIEQDEDMINNAMPKPIEQESASESESSESEVDDSGIDPDDPMREYLLKKLKKKAKKAKRKAEKESKAEKKADRRARREEKKARKEEREGKTSKETKDAGVVEAPDDKNDNTKDDIKRTKDKEEGKAGDTTTTAINGENKAVPEEKNTGRDDVERESYRARRRSRSRSPPPRHRSRSCSPFNNSSSKSYGSSSRHYDSRPHSRSPVRRRRSLSRSPSPYRRNRGREQDRYSRRDRSRSRSYSPRRRSPSRDYRERRYRRESRSPRRSSYRYESPSPSRRRDDDTREHREHRSRR
ncbi:hypothetical protein BGW42_007664 [Actinomortierella wolfii]|nr:hypothetical protein BGW42_007664 [Actinomortierella wolfii]